MTAEASVAPDTAALAALADQLDGEVHGDRLHRRLFAQDASPYRVLPAAVVHPRHARDCRRLVRFAREHGLSLIPRGGGTSLAGQCVGAGVVVDTSRHMTAIEWVDPEARRVRVQPGVTASQLNRALAPYGLRFAPDPSTASRATLAGMLGNNAWGPHALVDGTTRDWVRAIDAVGADGAAMRLSGAGGGDDADRRRRDALADLCRRHADGIAAGAGARRGRVPCDNNGYPLHTIDADAPNEAALLAGAEGTLALVTAVELGLRAPLPRPRLLCPHFETLTDAMRAVAPARDAGARAVELLDAAVLARTRGHPEQAANRFWLVGEPAAVLLVELDEEQETEAAAEALRAAGASTVAEVGGDDVQRVWSLRRAGLGLLMGTQGPEKAVSGLEDTAVAVDHLADYVAEAEQLFRREAVARVAYGSVGLGLVHWRPWLDLADGADRARYRRLLDGLAALVARYGGAWSTKHGDGRLRAPWLAAIYGEAWLAAMHAVKRLYDPAGVFNPGKIVDPPAPMADLRGGGGDPASTPRGFDWSGQGGLAAAAGRCHGAGACRQASVDGGMCPTYQATADELHGTRGRAHLFQQAFAAPYPRDTLAGDDLYQALSLCLGCKACQHECPAQVDMARLKAEHLYQRYCRYGMPLSARLAAGFAPLSAAAARVPRLANAIGRQCRVQRWLGLARRPPALAHDPLPRWLRRRRPRATPAGERVVLLLDPHTAYYEPSVGRSAVATLEALGYAVVVTRCVSAGRAAISQGALDRARRELADLRSAVDELQDAGDAFVVGLEPSELLTLRDEAPRLVRGAERAGVEAIAGRALLFEELLDGPARPALERVAASAAPGRVAVHVHCHARALAGVEPVRRALATVAADGVDVITRGCCGMAGAFGYTRATAHVARAVAELELAPAVRGLPASTTLLAHGVSCRQQVRTVTDREPWHPAELCAYAIGPDD